MAFAAIIKFETDRPDLNLGAFRRKLIKAIEESVSVDIDNEGGENEIITSVEILPESSTYFDSMTSHAEVLLLPGAKMKP